MRKQITFSIAATFRECKRKYHHRHIERLVRRERIPALDFGRITHRWLRLWHQGQSLDICLGEIEAQFAEAADAAENEQAQIESLELEREVARSMCRAYSRKYAADDFQVVGLEKEFRIPVVNPTTGYRSRWFDFAGKADGLVLIDGQYFLLEHKTTKEADLQSFISKLEMDTQALGYLYGLQRAREIEIQGILYNILRKPLLRMRKDEGLDGYLARIAQDYLDRPDFYFVRVRVYPNERELREFEEELYQLSVELRTCRYFYRNPGACSNRGGCPYRCLCIEDSPESRRNFVRLEERHPELTRVA